MATLSASAKILLYIAFSISLFLVEGTATALCLLSLSLVLLLLPGMRGGIIPISIFLLTTFLGNLFFYPGRVLMEIGPLDITAESLRIALVRTARVSGLVAGAKLLTLKTPVEEILGVLKRFFLPLERIRVPVSEFFETASLTLKLLPGIRDRALESYREGMNNTTRNGFIHRIRVIVALMLPLMIKTIQSPAELLTDKEETLDPGLNAVKGSSHGNK
ncbi:MAG: hypothetical protein GXO95_06850 [Nitrospirae bacterium]|nr:hypothetical protein [Nitrospirota bacterium]